MIKIVVRMQYIALLVLFIVTVLFFIGFRYSKEGFFDSHSDYVKRQAMQYNDIGISLTATQRVGALGNSADPMLETAGKNAGPNAGPMSKKHPLNTQVDGLWAQVAKCESVSTPNCAAFDDPNYVSSQCGMCLGVGQNSSNVATTGGLLLLDKDAQAAQVGVPPGYLPNYVPTIGSCPAGQMVSTKAECLALQAQLKCESSANYDLPGCSQCFANQSYSIVDPLKPGVVANYGNIIVIGSGILSVTQAGSTGSSITLSPTSETEVILSVKEGSQITMNISKDPASSKQAYMMGYLYGQTANGEFAMDLIRTVISDDQTGRKPLDMGRGSLNGHAVTKMAPGFSKNSMVLRIMVPFTFVDTSTVEASRCKTGPYVTTSSAATFLESDPCYKKGSGPGKYSLDCLQNSWMSNGCTEGGKGYPGSQSTAAMLMSNPDGSMRSLNDIASYVYSQALITSTGLDAYGNQQSIMDWSTASVFCTGNPITSPCDTANSATGPLSSQCIAYLWNNQGSHSLSNGRANHIGATYNGGTSLFSSGSVKRGCQVTGTLSPINQDGTTNQANFAYWSNKGGVQDVKAAMSQLQESATAKGVSNVDRILPFKQCYGDMVFNRNVITTPVSLTTPVKTCVGNVFTTRTYTPTQGQVIARNLTMTQDFTLSFDITPTGILGAWGSILHFTQGGNIEKIGDRSPGIWFHPGSTNLHVRLSTQNDVNPGFDNIPGCSIGNTTPIVLTCKGLVVSLQVGGKTYNMTQDSARYSGPITVYSGDPWYPSANCVLENLCMVPEGNSIKVCSFAPGLPACNRNPSPGWPNPKCGEFVTVFGRPNFSEFNFAIPVGQWNTIDEIRRIPGNNGYTIYGGDGNVSFIFPTGCPLKLTINDGPNFTGSRTFVITKTSPQPLTSGSGGQFKFIPGWSYAQSIKCERM